MTSLEHTRALYADLAKELGVPALQPDANGGIQLTIGEDITVVLYGENDERLLVVVPVAELPRSPDHGVVAWVLRRNLYDSDLAPFCIAADDDANLILWGRVPIANLTGARLAGMLDAVAAEAIRIRDEVEVEEE
ncbi:MAG: CesT family type III secretion system chaperone [Planctomycetes bacterium]|nr:CesT family type III secretion system chaperone [Planctomycetota bacterium]